MGALLCVVCAVVILAYAFFFVSRWWKPLPGLFPGYGEPLWIVVPVVAGVFVLAGLGFWLGWIMASTKEVAPPPATVEEPVERKRRKRRK